MDCSTCVRKGIPCQQQRPRCASCKKSHLKCAYDAASTPAFTFKDESESTKENYERSKRQKVGDAMEKSGSLPSNAISHVIPESNDSIFSLPYSPDFEWWADEIYGGFDLEDSYLELQQQDPAAAISSEALSEPQSDQPYHFPESSEPMPSVRAPQESSESNSPESRVPVHLLTHHYARNLVGRFTSKNADWSFFMYFYNRFTRSHPFVLYSIPGWTSAHLHFAGKLDNLDTSFAYHDKAMGDLTALPLASLSMPLNQPDHDNLDAAFVAYFYLATTDIVTARTKSLERIMERFLRILEVAQAENALGAVQARVVTWFCVYDAKASIFSNWGGRILSDGWRSRC